MNGKFPSVFLKILAVVSALAIGGGYVAYKNVGAEETKQRAQAERDKEKAEEEQKESALIVGSKSISMPLFTKEARDFITPIDGTGKAFDAPVVKDVLLPSSKIGIIVMPEIITEFEPAEEEPPKLLPGPKPPNLLLDNPERKKSR